jgi:PAS domain S-box-containing protein
VVDSDVVESEERLRLATEAADMFAWEIDFNNDKIIWAPNSARVIGCRPEELSDDPANGAFFAIAEDTARILEEFQSALARGDENYTLEFRGNDGAGERTFWQARGKFIRDASGKVVRAVGATQNITRQKKAEEELRLIAERLSAAEEAAGALIYDWDIAAQKMWRSDGLTKMLGWEQEDVPANSGGWAALRHPDDEKPTNAMAFADHIQKDDHYVLEYRARHRDGHYIWVLDSGRVFRDASGTVIRAAGAIVDISARKRVEESSKLQANLIDLSFEPIFVWHPERGIVDWNRGAEQLYGYTREEALGQSSQKLLQSISALPLNDIMAILKIGNSWTGELEHRAKDGRRVFVESRHQTIEVDGETLILETNHDITQRKRAENYTASLAAVALASHDALFGITLDGTIETWNPAAERLFGYTASEIIGRNVSIFAAPGQHAEQYDLLERANANETIGPYNARRLRKDGSFIDVSVALAPVRSTDGKVVSISVAIHDISDQKEWQARQRLMTRELAHRIKNSFAVLQGILRSTLRTSRNPQDFAEAFSGRLHSLAAAQDVLTANDWKGAELGALIKLQLAAYVTNEDQRLEISGPQLNLPAELASPFGLIFNELATNALKYGALSVPEGKIQISWRTEQLNNVGTKLLLSWCERGGPPVSTQTSRGFGSTLIQKSLAGAIVESRFDPEGLICTIELILTTFGKLKRVRKGKKVQNSLTIL